MVDTQKELRTELDFLAECLIKLRSLTPAAIKFIHTNPGERNPHAAMQNEFQREIIKYFDLPNHLEGWTFFNVILRLYETPAGTSKEMPHEAE